MRPTCTTGLQQLLLQNGFFSIHPSYLTPYTFFQKSLPNTLWWLSLAFTAEGLIRMTASGQQWAVKDTQQLTCQFNWLTFALHHLGLCSIPGACEQQRLKPACTSMWTVRTMISLHILCWLTSVFAVHTCHKTDSYNPTLSKYIWLRKIQVFTEWIGYKLGFSYEILTVHLDNLQILIHWYALSEIMFVTTLPYGGGDREN